MSLEAIENHFVAPKEIRLIYVAAGLAHETIVSFLWDFLSDGFPEVTAPEDLSVFVHDFDAESVSA